MSKHFNPFEAAQREGERQSQAQDESETETFWCNKVLHETPKALKVDVAGGIGTVWVPKWAIHDDSEVYKHGDGSGGNLIVLYRWADKEGWV